ncbi:CNNM domain-containing protein [Candidatus Similichlamydia epinepheli]|uniref:CNNM domain-containing protein n=1 Tax=Candidatus Similichlamydia epinepheli TaxID=1903953 RepID=UPI000D3694EB|nr:CNNM domain-containing protein [Candidatus Similichlamydia epinepheli]
MIRFLVTSVSLFCCLGIQSISSLCLASFFSFSRSQLKSFRAEKDSKLVLIAHLMKNPEKVLVTILFLGTMGTILCQNLVSYLLMGTTSSWLRVFLPMMLSSVIAEILPKVFAIEYNASIAKFLVVPFFNIHKLLYYPRMVTISVANILTGFLSPFLKDSEQPTLEEQIDAIDLSQENPLISKEEKSLFQSYLRLARLQVSEVARPIHESDYLDLELPVGKFRNLSPEFIGCEIPVVSGHVGNVLGTLDIRRLTPSSVASNEDIRHSVKPPFFVPESRPLAFVLETLKTENISLVFVINEFGGVIGVVNLQIIMRSIWGGDEPVPDHIPGFFVRVDGVGIVASGRMDLELFKRVSGISLSAKSGQTTLGGWIVAKCRELLFPGSVLQIGELRIHVLSVENCFLKHLYIQHKSLEK